MPLDLNCDLGEGESPAKTEALMRCVSSANIACGGHAGDITSMENAIGLALRYGVGIGAHPGSPDRAKFGRVEVRLLPSELSALLVQQISGLETIAHALNTRLRHVKLHGALYHITERNPELAAAYLETIQCWWPRLIIFSLAKGKVLNLAKQRGLAAWGEAFLDRAYLPDATLVPRAEPGALLTRFSELKARLLSLRNSGELTAREGTLLRLRPRTLSIHSDSPNSTRIARLAAATLAAHPPTPSPACHKRKTP